MLLLGYLNANVEVEKTATVNIYVNKSKSLEQLKAMALKQAKLDALSEIFGDFVKSEATVSNGRLLESLVEENSNNGAIHIKGEPKYSNGKNFGDIQVKITAYATDKDIYRFTPQLTELKGFKYSNKKAPLKKLKGLAENAFIIEALSKINPAVKKLSSSNAKKLTTSLEIKKENMVFDTESMTYTISGKVGYVPFNIEQIGK